jgi:long-chain fatty acid transport protein
MQKYFLIILVLIASVLPSKAIAGGFLVYNQDATANSLGLAYAAQVESPAAVLYNPAAINQLEGTQCSFNTTIITYSSDFHSSQTGEKTKQDDHVFILPSFFATKKLNEKWSVGFGTFTYYGLTTDWPNDWEGRYISTFAQLRSFFINPVISYQLTPKITIAGGINGIYTDVLQRKNINIKPLPDGRVRFKGDDIGWGVNFALLYRFTERMKFALTYRSKVSLNYTGDVKFQVPKFLKRLVPEGGASIDIDLPALLTSGVCYTLNDKWTIEFDVIFTDWSVYDKLDLKYDKKVPKIMSASTAPIIRDYHDTWSYCFGISYKYTNAVTLRAGYLFDPGAVPEENIDPVLPDSDKNIFGFGINYIKGQIAIDISDYLSFYKGRNVRNNRDGLNGRYESSVNIIAFNLSYFF